jgi:hypothetical protein
MFSSDFQGATMFARVLFVDEDGKRVGLSVLPHLLRLRPYAFRVALGQVLTQGEVVETMDALESKGRSAAVLEFQAGMILASVSIDWVVLSLFASISIEFILRWFLLSCIDSPGDLTQHVYLIKSRAHEANTNNNSKSSDVLPLLGDRVRKCRVMGFNRLEGVVYGSTQPPDLARQYVAASEIPIGSKLEVLSKHFCSSRFKVSISGHSFGSEG